MRKAILGLATAVLLLGCQQGGEPTGKRPEYRSVTWKELASFPYRPSVHPKQKSTPKPVAIPPSVQVLDGQRLQLSGYMVPVEVDGHNVLTFVLVRDQQACCYGKMPQMNEFVFVRLPKGKDLEMKMDVPIQVNGNFEVGEDIQEGAVVSLYRMVADTVQEAKGLQAGWKAN